MKCSKSGIKIHETKYTNNTNANLDPDFFYNKIKNQNKHTGVRIEKSNNEYQSDPFGNINPFTNKEKEIENIKYDNSMYSKLDLNINNYSIEDLYKLFGIQTNNLTENILRETKKIVLKTHPDKSKLEPKYFLFFSAAYKRLYGIYEFQNKTEKKFDTNKITITNLDNNSNENGAILEKMFEKNNNLKDPKKFNEWFNTQFDKHKLEDGNETGYGEWLKSNDGICDLGNVSQANISVEMEKHKKLVQNMVVYNGVNDIFASSFGGSTLMDVNNNYTSGSLFTNDGMGYTDLRQAYVESVIPVTEDDYAKIPKFETVDKYIKHRESMTIAPPDKELSMRKLYQQNKEKDEQSAALAYHYAQQSEKVQKNNDSFWYSLHLLTFQTPIFTTLKNKKM